MDFGLLILLPVLLGWVTVLFYVVGRAFVRHTINAFRQRDQQRHGFDVLPPHQPPLA